MKYDVTVLTNNSADEDAELSYKQTSFTVTAPNDSEARTKGKETFHRRHKNDGDIIWLTIRPRKSIYRME